MLPDLARGLGIDFRARQRGEFVADIHHRVTAFAFTVIDSKAEADRASLTPDFRDEAVSLVHLPRRFYRSEDRTILSECQIIRAKIIRAKKSDFGGLLTPSR